MRGWSVLGHAHRFAGVGQCFVDVRLELCGDAETADQKEAAQCEQGPVLRHPPCPGAAAGGVVDLVEGFFDLHQHGDGRVNERSKAKEPHEFPFEASHVVDHVGDPLIEPSGCSR
jgi:hypothetical protein